MIGSQCSLWTLPREPDLDNGVEFMHERLLWGHCILFGSALGPWLLDYPARHLSDALLVSQMRG